MATTDDEIEAIAVDMHLPATSPSLPSVVVYAILQAMEDGRDVAAFLAALPDETLPPELAALRDLGAVVDLADHWPFVRVVHVPTEYARVAIAALPAFGGVLIDPGFAALAWLDAELPPATLVYLVLDPSVSGVPGAFAFNWGDCITHVIVHGHTVAPDPIPDILAHCMHVQSVSIVSATTPAAAAAYLGAIVTTDLRTLSVHVASTGALDTSGIVAWLHGLKAISLSITCDTVDDPTALAHAIHACATMWSLSLDGAMDVQGALVRSPYHLHHIRTLTLVQSTDQYVDVFAKLHPDNIGHFSLKKAQGHALAVPRTMGALRKCAVLENIALVHVHISTMSARLRDCFWLASATFQQTTFENPQDVVATMRWLSTSRHLRSVDLDGTVLGRAGVVELARALPLWMATGLKTLALRGSQINDKDAIVLAVALASGRNRRPLTIAMTGNQLTAASAPALLTALAACCDVTLHVGSIFVDSEHSATADATETKRVCTREAATRSPSLPSVVVYLILEALRDGKSVTAFLSALPPLTLPPELIALRDLGAVVDLACHWPVLHITKIPIQYARLGAAALPVFAGVYIDTGFTALDWLDATPQRAVTLVVDPSVPGTLTTFAYNWGNRITNVVVKGHKVKPDPIPDLLGRCVNVQSASIESAATQAAAAAYLAALSTQHLRTLKVTANGTGLLDTSAIVAWLQEPSATSLHLACASVTDPRALASAIRACATLSTLHLDGVVDVQAALATASGTFDHDVSGLSLRSSSGEHGIPILANLDRTKVVSFALENTHANVLLVANALSTIGECTALETVTLTKWSLPAVTTTTGACPRLVTATLRQLTCVPTSVPRIIRWLSTSRRLTDVDFTGTVLGSDGVLELARALPAWMARGLQTLQLEATGLNDKDAIVVAIALASNRNRNPLTIHLTGNQFTMASAPVLLTTLGASRDVTLHLNGPLEYSKYIPYPYDEDDPYGRHLARYNQRVEDSHILGDLIEAHKLRYVSPGTYMSPSRTSSPWHPICL
ncbi:hypothetical protein SPRG_16496 [Saprolegnia parasitica CBS 223.65]|uniref:Uncharacterized protein n=1 Tax=Saprolegnia parasitica (strain CBS 223.65) TaxID=695850 RepID=A0A067BN14_SAPPC|nr:hypothetical protein SPRG_16496 [Saprolegnia parasitica CBS 223.65]KDO18135.1 hypothetical protein SPRG_16496 [Saprolegnia parasitica CBS 223.65]|eukprot:XP_012211160.1 hypothetical protein SPRG_16496 [Saprolegnia parasitica CBS 223.65]